MIPRPDPEARAWRVAGALFAGSAVGVTGLGVAWWAIGGAGFRTALASGGLFAASVLGFFVAHEAGHLLVARWHRIAVGPPWFTPVGVVMHLREPPATRTGLLELGAAGPLAGFAALAALAVARLAWGGPMPPADPRLHLATPLLWRVLALPWGGGSVSADDPVAAAFCVGALVTALNLLPFGQLDGGHVAAALWPGRAVAISWAITAVLLAAGFWWWGFAVWAAVIHLAGTRYPLRPRREGQGPSRRARGVAVAAAVAFVLCATPAPFR